MGFCVSGVALFSLCRLTVRCFSSPSVSGFAALLLRQLTVCCRFWAWYFRLHCIVFVPVVGTVLFPDWLFQALSLVLLFWFAVLRCIPVLCFGFVPVFGGSHFVRCGLQRCGSGILPVSGFRFAVCPFCGNFGLVIFGLLQSSRHNLSLKADPVPSGFFGLF